MTQSREDSDATDTECLAQYSALEAKLLQLQTGVVEETIPVATSANVEIHMRAALHQALDQMIEQVPGFSLMVKEGKHQRDDIISINTIRSAIEHGYFPDFDSFEYVLFRLAEQAKQELLEFEIFTEQRHDQVEALMKQQCIKAIIDCIEKTEVLFTQQEKKQAKKRSTNFNVQIELLVASRGRGRPVKPKPGQAVNPLQNCVLKPKLFSLTQLSLKQLTMIVEAINLRQFLSQQELIARISDEIDRAH